MRELTNHELLLLCESLVNGHELYVTELVERIELVTGYKPTRQALDTVLKSLQLKYAEPYLFGIEFCRTGAMVFFRSRDIKEIINPQL